MKVVRRISHAVVGYLFLLLAFALLGLFVAAFAYQSEWATVAGAALGVSLVAAVVGFRRGAARLAQSRGTDDADHNVSIWSEPLRQEQVDRYHVNYRGGQQAVPAPVALRTRPASPGNRPEVAVPSRLSA